MTRGIYVYILRVCSSKIISNARPTNRRRLTERKAEDVDVELAPLPDGTKESEVESDRE